MGELKRKSPFTSSFAFAAIVVCILIGLVLAVVIPNTIRPVVGDAAHPPCIVILREIDSAKNEWALENGKTNGVICTENDIKPYIKLDAKGNLPKCPQGGIYTIGKVGEPPTCSLGTNVNPAHVLP